MRLGLLALLLAACSSGSREGSPRVDASAERSDGGLRQDAQTALPASCPCPQGSYCDLATNRCVVGCATDRDCAEGSICDDRTCRTGCREDGACGSGEVCDEATKLCRAGCRTDADCPREALCDLASSSCVPGCYDNDGCIAPHTCNAGVCSGACMRHLDCPSDQHCDLERRECVAGCWADESGEASETAASCAPGMSCTRADFSGYYRTSWCDEPPCNWECTPRCSNDCPDVDDRDFVCFGGSDEGSLCREQCDTDADCPAGELCANFQTSLGASRRLCSNPCGSDADCTSARGYYGGACRCSYDGRCYVGEDECVGVESSHGL